MNFPLEYEDIMNTRIDCGVGQALKLEGGSKCNTIADTQYKALTRGHWIWPSEDD